MTYAEEKYLVKEMAHASAPAITAELNHLARDGWRLTHVVGDFHYFEREAPDIMVLDHELTAGIDQSLGYIAEQYGKPGKHVKKGKK